MTNTISLDLDNFSNPLIRGEAPLSNAQFERRINGALNRLLMQSQFNFRVETALNRLLTLTQIEQMTPSEKTAHAQIWQKLLIVEAEAKSINDFNLSLSAYRTAKTRLTRYRLADGQSEQFEDQPSGDKDPITGGPKTRHVRTRHAVDALPANVTKPALDAITGEYTRQKEVPNPLILADDAERAQAQSIIDAATEEVKNYV